MIRFLINRPVGVLVSFFTLFLLGLCAFWYLPTSLMPDTDIPEISIRLRADDYSASEIEQRMVGPLRSRLQQLKGLLRIESTSTEGRGQIALTFEHRVNTGLSFIEVNEKVDIAMNDLPRNAERPLVNKASVLDIPVFSINVYPVGQGLPDSRFAELSNFAQEVISRRIEQLPEVAMVDLSGTVSPEVVIIPRTNDLQALRIPESKLGDALREHQINPGNILVKDGHYQYYLHFSTGIYNINEIAATPLNIAGRVFRLGDLADVRMGNAEERGRFLANGRRAVNLRVLKQSSAKMDDLKANFDQLLVYMRSDYPDIVFEVTQDQRALLDYAVSNLQQDLIIGSILAFFFMLIFIRKWRSAFLIGTTIPLSLVISQLGFYLLGISLNVISLGGLILGLGMVIDNSIVVIDTITARRARGEPVVTAAINGTNEILRPLITSVLTNCAVFIPLIFMSGIAGAIFYDQALSVTIGVISSLLVAILLLPTLYVLLYQENGGEREIKARISVTRWYEVGLKKVFNYPKLTVAITFLFLVSGGALFYRLDKQRIPPISRDDMIWNIDWNESINLTENVQRVQYMLNKTKSDIVQANVWVGEQQYLLAANDELSNIQARIYMKVSNKRRLRVLQEKLTVFLAKTYPQATVKFTLAPNAFDAIFASELAVLQIHLYDANKRAMPTIEQSVAAVKELRTLLPDAFINTVPLHDKVVLRIRVEEAAVLGVGMNDIRNALHSALSPAILDYYQGAQSLMPIVMQHTSVVSLNGLLQTNFVTRGDQPPIRLSELVDIRSQQDYQSFKAGIEGQYYPVDIETVNPIGDLPIVQAWANRHKDDISVSYVGSYFENRKLTKEMMLVLLVSVLLLYFILAAQFESLIQPLFVLVELPIAVSGALLALWLGGNNVNLMSMIGMVIMCGLVINDSILKIDAINQSRKQGLPLLEAIYEGGHKRLKPMVMISLTSTGALLPTLFMHDLGSELQKPLAFALIGGMLIGLFVSLFFVPLLYWCIYQKQENKTKY